MNDAIGIIEMFGFVTAITAADAAAKAADVKVIAIDSNKPANADSVEVLWLSKFKAVSVPLLRRLTRLQEQRRAYPDL